MKVREKLVAIIPARGGSKRIKNKNIINFLGRPIISYTIDLLKKTGIFEKIHVSTDSKKICNIVEKNNLEIDFLRPKRLANDKVGVYYVLKYVVEKYKSMNINFKAAALVYPCSPLLRKKDILNSYKLLKKNKYQYPILSISEFLSAPERSLSLEKNNFIKVDNVKKFRARTQDLKKKYFDTGNLVFVPCNKIKQIVKNQNNKPCHKFMPYLLEKKRAIDIDTYEDLRFAEMLYKIDNKI